jgi:hypothetical protein
MSELELSILRQRSAERQCELPPATFYSGLPGQRGPKVADVRAWVDRLRASLPQSADVAALGVKSKAPFQLLWTREALIWRTDVRPLCAPMKSRWLCFSGGNVGHIGHPDLVRTL